MGHYRNGTTDAMRAQLSRVRPRWDWVGGVAGEIPQRSARTYKKASAFARVKRNSTARALPKPCRRQEAGFVQGRLLKMALVGSEGVRLVDFVLSGGLPLPDYFS